MMGELVAFGRAEKGRGFKRRELGSHVERQEVGVLVLE